MPSVSSFIRKVVTIVQQGKPGEPGKPGKDAVALPPTPEQLEAAVQEFLAAHPIPVPQAPSVDLSDVNRRLAALEESSRGQATRANEQGEAIAALQGRKQLIALPDVTVPAAALITTTVGERPFADRPCAGVRVGDTLMLVPKTQPAGYYLTRYTVTKADAVNLWAFCPLLAVAGPTLAYSVLVLR